MTRTTRAVLLTATAVALLVVSIGWLLGLDPVSLVLPAAIAAALGGALIAGAARRAGTAGDDPTPTTDDRNTRE